MPRFQAALLLAAVVSFFAPVSSAFAQGFPGQAPAPQQQMVFLTEDNLPQMLQGPGFTVQEKVDHIGKLWIVQNQQLGANTPIVALLLKNRNGQVIGFGLGADLGAKVNPNEPGLANALLSLMKSNAVNAPYCFSCDEKTGHLQLIYTHLMPDSNQSEVQATLNRFTRILVQTRPFWSRQGANAGNGGGLPPAQQPVFTPPAQQPVFTPPAQQPVFTPPVQQPVFAPPAQVQVVNVAQTVWNGSETLQGFGKLTFQFIPGGQAFMIDAQSKVAGRWVQNGNQVTITFGDCVYQGTINGQVLSGTARYNNNTANWTFTVTKTN